MISVVFPKIVFNVSHGTTVEQLLVNSGLDKLLAPSIVELEAIRSHVIPQLMHMLCLEIILDVASPFGNQFSRWEGAIITLLHRVLILFDVKQMQFSAYSLKQEE